MDKAKNPFSPGAGSPPPELAGRDELLAQAELALDRVKGGRNAQSQFLVGLRGVGKTVLLNKIRERAEGRGYLVAMYEASEGKTLGELLIPGLRQVLFRLDSYAKVSDKAKRGLRVLRSFLGMVKLKVDDFEIGLDVDPEKGSGDSGDFQTDLTELFVATAEAAKDRGTAVAIVIDEIQYLDEGEMTALIMAVHQLSQRQLPLVVVGAGLPQVVGLAGKAKSYAERLFIFPKVGALSPSDARDALREPVISLGVQFSDIAIDEVYRVTHGYPYFLQEWGYEAWNIAPRSPIDLDAVYQATPSALRKLDQSFFRVRFDRLTPSEKEYMRALAALGPSAHRSGDVAACLGKKPEAIAPLRSGLIKKGVIYSPSYGDTCFTVPLFDEFMVRTMPDWQRKDVPA